MKHAYFFTEAQNDDQLLETDVMRFAAIIGIVFWIIFTLVKSIPFQSAATSTFILPSTFLETESLPPVRKNATHATDAAAIQPGIDLHFKSRGDLISLMGEGKVRIYCRAQDRGFNIFFAGSPSPDGQVTFTVVPHIPTSLWEIKNGSDHSYFLDLISQSYPELRSFDSRQVYIAFLDAPLETKAETALRLLGRQGKAGILSIDAAGEVTFEELRYENDFLR